MFRSIAIVFSTYSKIPMPIFEWKEEDLRYSMCAFPLVGLVLAALSCGAYRLMLCLGAGNLLTAGVMTVLPLIFTGGIHMDGYMDTMDALSSCGSREKKLEILKDPHIGAFAVIHAVIYTVAELSLWSELARLDIEGYMGNMLFYLVMAGYVMSRTLSAASVLTFKKAKADGMVSDLSKAQGTKCRTIIAAVLILLIVLMFVLYGIYALCTVIPAVSVFLFYRRMSYRSFEGITGDLAGWFLQICELSVLFTVVMTSMILKL